MTRKLPITKKKKNEWQPRYCLACHEVIRPDEKQASYTTAKRAVYYFHEEHFNELLGRPRGGRRSMNKVDLLVFAVDRKKEEYLLKKLWNEQDFELFNGMKQILSQLPKASVSSITPTNRPPKAHVIDEFQPHESKKQDDLSYIIELLRDGTPRTSKMIAKEIPIPRSTITFRLWDHCQGNDKSDKEEIFYIAKRIKGEQHYSLISLRINADKHAKLIGGTSTPFGDSEFGTIPELKHCELCGGVMKKVAKDSKVWICLDGHTEVRK